MPSDLESNSYMKSREKGRQTGAISNRDIISKITYLMNLKPDASLSNYERQIKENGENMVYDYYAYLECNYDAERFWETTLKEKKPEVSPAHPTWSDDDNELDHRHNLNDMGYKCLQEKCINAFNNIESQIKTNITEVSTELENISSLYTEISEQLKNIDIKGMNLSNDYSTLSENTEITISVLNNIISKKGS